MDIQSTFFWFMAASALALAFAVFAVWSIRRKAAGRFGTVLRFSACLLICFALIEPAALRPGGRPTVAALIDASDSAAPNEQQRNAVERLSNDKRVRFVRFAKRAALGTDGRTLDPSSTDIEGALAYAADLLRASERSRILLFSDGAETYGNARAMIPRLRAEGVSVFAAPLDSAKPPPLRIRELRLPPSAPVGPVGGRIAVESETGGEAEMTAYVDGKLAMRRSLQLEAGYSSVDFSLTAESSGEKHVVAAIRLPSGEEARSAAYVQIDGAIKGLYVHGGAERTAVWSALIGDPSIEWRETEADALDSSGLRLQEYDAVVFDNVSAESISFEWMESFRAWVENGGGWLAVGGPNSFGAGKWTQTALEKVAPVTMTPPDKRKPLALVLLLDKSGSAARRSKWTLAVRAAEAAARALHPKDKVAVIAFDAKPQTAVPLIEAGKRGTRIERLAELSPGGGTDLAAGLQAAYDLLRKADAPRKHAVVFSDGHSTTDPSETARRMFEAGMTVSAAAVGSDARADLEEASRLGGGAFYPLKDASDLPDVFVRETIQTGELIIQQKTEASAPFPSALAEGLELTADGYVSAEAKSTAAVFLKAQEGDPLLVGWRYGLGRALAFLSDGGNRWTTDWATSEGYADRWRSWLRWTAPSAETGEEYDLSVETVGSALTVRAEFPNEADVPSRFSAETVDPTGGRASIEMKREGNGFVGRGRLGSAGAYAVSAGPWGGQTILRRVHYDGRAETLAPPNLNLLKALTDATGGTTASELGDWILPPDKEPRSLSAWLLFGVLALMAVEWILRQLRLPSRKRAVTEQAPYSTPEAFVEEPPLFARLRGAKERARGR